MTPDEMSDLSPPVALDAAVLNMIREAVDETDLRGLDYLTQKQAARYAGVSLSQFKAKAAEYRILPQRFMGKMLYRKTDIQRAIENQWRV